MLKLNSYSALRPEGIAVASSPAGILVERLAGPGSRVLSLNAPGRGHVPLLSGAELMFDPGGTVRGHQMDLEAKRHFQVTDWTVHG